MEWDAACLRHSVLEDCGTLYDITLPPEVGTTGIRFLRHVGTYEEFLAIRGQYPELQYPPYSVVQWLEAQSSTLDEGPDFLSTVP
jgi:hypothetical protein